MKPEEGEKLDNGEKLEESANSEQTRAAPKIRLFVQGDKKQRNHPVVQREKRFGRNPELRIRKHHAGRIIYFRSCIHSLARVAS